MARQGLFLEPEGFAWELARFQRGEPRAVEYRLISRRKPQKLWKCFLRGDPEQFEGPREEEVDLFAQFGWTYWSKCGNFFVYQAEGDGPCEVDSDPSVQAISIQAVRDWEVACALSMIFVLVLDHFLFLYGWLLQFIAQGYLVYLLGVFSMLFLVLAQLFLQFLAMERLRRKLERGEPLRHRKPWRRWAWLHYLNVAVSAVVVLFFLGSMLCGPGGLL